MSASLSPQDKSNKRIINSIHRRCARVVLDTVEGEMGMISGTAREKILDEIALAIHRMEGLMRKNVESQGSGT